MSNYKPNIKTLPFVILAIFGILLIYDTGLEQEKIIPEKISETLSLDIQNAPKIQSRNIHLVEQGENLSLIFEKYNVPLNDTYQIFRKDKSDEIKNIIPVTGVWLKIDFVGSIC